MISFDLSNVPKLIYWLRHRSRVIIKIRFGLLRIKPGSSPKEFVLVTVINQMIPKLVIEHIRFMLSGKTPYSPDEWKLLSVVIPENRSPTFQLPIELVKKELEQRPDKKLEFVVVRDDTKNKYHGSLDKVLQDELEN